MKNRREFLGACGAAASVMAMPAAGAILAPIRARHIDASGLEVFKGLRGERIALREGGSVVVGKVEAVGSDLRWEQCLMQVVPSTRMESGIYHLQTADGPRALYLESGGSADQPTLTAALSRPRV